MLVVAERFLVFPEREALFGQISAGRDGVGDLQLVGERSVALARIERRDDAAARLLALHAAEPLRQQLDQHIGERAEAG